ncbi:hypothetical protein EC973_000422 [Apophysomyces ossiformis]|uniref:HTH APSES-type domain-containing protein n=1 Tax=Apophysomyces ossiformis TaxID=679940 RepID=A0A8H7ESL8_9FUNG|nr:hypothetical protein EC973_000422 [Apophysomyces ossiformis]
MSATAASYTTSPHYFVAQTTTQQNGDGFQTSSSHHHYSSSPYGLSYLSNHGLIPRPKLTTTLWEDEATLCYQVDAKGICVARRQDNDMVNGTKLLNVAGMSRGKRDGILKNEKGRVVVKVGAMHLKGVWITFTRAKALAAQYKIQDILYPLFADDPSMFMYTSPFQHYPIGSNRFIPSAFRPPISNWDPNTYHDTLGQQQQQVYRSSMDDMYGSYQSVDYRSSSGTIPGVGGMVGDSYHNHRLSASKSMYYEPSSLDDSKRQEAAKQDAGGIKEEAGLSQPNSPNLKRSSLQQLSSFKMTDTRERYYSSTAADVDSNTMGSSPTMRRNSLLMNVPGRMGSPRHHPYSVNNKMHPPSMMSALPGSLNYRSVKAEQETTEHENTSTKNNNNNNSSSTNSGNRTGFATDDIINSQQPW